MGTVSCGEETGLLARQPPTRSLISAPFDTPPPPPIFSVISFSPLFFLSTLFSHLLLLDHFSALCAEKYIDNLFFDNKFE